MVIMIMKNTVTLHSCVTCEYTGNHEEVTAAHHELRNGYGLLHRMLV